MNTHTRGRTALALACLLACSGAFAAPLTKAEFNAAKERIEVDLKADRNACDTQSGNARDICQERAKGKEKMARAELEYRQSGKAADADKLNVATADATYAVSRETCDDKAGQAKDVCITEAKTQHTKALADAKLQRQVGAARSDAVDDKREADRKLADEKCEALAGDPKAGCLAESKARFGDR
jgi:hypothetical protein